MVNKDFQYNPLKANDVKRDQIIEIEAEILAFQTLTCRSRDPDHAHFKGDLSSVCWDLTLQRDGFFHEEI